MIKNKRTDERAPRARLHALHQHAQPLVHPPFPLFKVILGNRRDRHLQVVLVHAEERQRGLGRFPLLFAHQHLRAHFPASFELLS